LGYGLRPNIADLKSFPGRQHTRDKRRTHIPKPDKSNWFGHDGNSSALILRKAGYLVSGTKLSLTG
jgi:hypothetical protein